MAKSAGRPAGLPEKTGQCTRLAETPSVTKSSASRWSRVAPDTITPPRVARSITRAATLTSTPSQSAARRCGRPVWIPTRIRGCVAVDVDGLEGSFGLQHRAHGDTRIGEHRHGAVTHPFDDVSAGVQQGRFDRAGHPPQQFERRVVTGTQRPVGEFHQVGEDDRHLFVRRAPRHRLGQRLPHLKCAQADFPGRAAPLTQQSTGGPGRGAGPALAGRREWVAEVGIAGQAAPGPPDQCDQAGTLIGAAQPLRRSTQR